MRHGHWTTASASFALNTNCVPAVICQSCKFCFLFLHLFPLFNVYIVKTHQRILTSWFTVASFNYDRDAS